MSLGSGTPCQKIKKREVEHIPIDENPKLKRLRSSPAFFRLEPLFLHSLSELSSRPSTLRVFANVIRDVRLAVRLPPLSSVAHIEYRLANTTIAGNRHQQRRIEYDQQVGLAARITASSAPWRSFSSRRRIRTGRCRVEMGHRDRSRRFRAHLAD